MVRSHVWHVSRIPSSGGELVDTSRYIQGYSDSVMLMRVITGDSWVSETWRPLLTPDDGGDHSLLQTTSSCISIDHMAAYSSAERNDYGTKNMQFEKKIAGRMLTQLKFLAQCNSSPIFCSNAYILHFSFKVFVKYSSLMDHSAIRRIADCRNCAS